MYVCKFIGPSRLRTWGPSEAAYRMHACHVVMITCLNVLRIYIRMHIEELYRPKVIRVLDHPKNLSHF